MYDESLIYEFGTYTRYNSFNFEYRVLETSRVLNIIDNTLLLNIFPYTFFSRHRIPKHERGQSVWLHRIGNQKLFEAETSNYAICKDHFHPICLSETNRLRQNSLPTRNLPGVYDEPNECFMQLPVTPPIAAAPYILPGYHCAEDEKSFSYDHI
ncbi:unnamed protein product [Callosobruchus maculatus]|uniref:THAP-type domain-containing protein n=1 Tax=Callosobruchus maculatus TaxID=64391 RepID=A0A653D699_CALMS|nr:unnamed protein product [Callosobruchus maculatus]